MNFYNFMMKNYKDAKEPKGDLARDMYGDRDSFPRNGKGKFEGWRKVILNYLERNGACTECLDTFEEAWEEYVRCEKSRLRRRS